MQKPRISQRDLARSRELSTTSQAVYRQTLMKYILDADVSLSFHSDREMLLKHIIDTAKHIPGFSCIALYLQDGADFCRVVAESEQILYRHQESLPVALRAQFLADEYRVENAYMIPLSALAQHEWMRKILPAHKSHDEATTLAAEKNGPEQQDKSLLILPLMSSSETLLGFFTFAFPIYDLELTSEIIGLLTLFARQVAVAIKSAAIYTELREALQRAQDSEQLKNYFLITASHELRTPLTAIQGYLELLDNFKATLSEDIRANFLTNARRACDELTLLLRNVMDVSHIDQDRIEVKLRPARLRDAVETIVEILNPLILKEKRTINLDVPDTLYVWVDDLRVRQILLNLVNNALKYSPEGTHVAIYAEQMTYEVLCQRFPAVVPIERLSDNKEYAVVAVQDWGAGIALEEQSQLFTRFKRLKSAINGPQRGAGLGLYLCSQLSEAMKGYIWLESTGVAGEGSTFRVALPLKKSEKVAP